jgi:hypothetical protein
VSKNILAVVKKNDSKVRAAMKAAGVKVGQAMTPKQSKSLADKIDSTFKGVQRADKARTAEMKRLGIKRFATPAELKALEATDGESTVMPTKAELKRRLEASKKLDATSPKPTAKEKAQAVTAAWKRIDAQRPAPPTTAEIEAVTGRRTVTVKGKAVQLTAQETSAYDTLCGNALDCSGGDFFIMEEVMQQVGKKRAQAFGGLVTSLQTKGVINVDKPHRVNDEHVVTQGTIEVTNWKNPKAAAALTKANAESAAKAKGGAVKGKAPKAAAVQPATKGAGANKGAKGEAFCSKCGRDNGRPTSPDCRNGAACKARVAAAGKQATA